MTPQTIDWISTLYQDHDDLGEIFSTSASTTPALLPGERRTVAVLFLDLEGFTAMSEQLDHETLHKITSGVMGRLSRMVEFHGGYVDKFEGDRIMALFGAEMAHENDCVRAVSCAMRMVGVVQEFSAFLRDRGFAVDSRAGISFGDVTVAPDPSGHITATGDIVNTASRMEETAEAGTVQVTEDVRIAAGEHFDWEDLGLVPVRGKTGELHTFRPAGPGRRQLERWERARELSSVPFVGRTHELRTLADILQKQSGGSYSRNRRGGARHL
ncbi:MAG: adenylate/guanylate cyclase domain-containing protein, partial [Candidatus Fermentibacteraceae bacterium]|nr:adenylate/guanylate cyclase domain-containing protein [Candidatus Fermentibacteraceae bacterium]